MATQSNKQRKQAEAQEAEAAAAAALAVDGQDDQEGQEEEEAPDFPAWDPNGDLAEMSDDGAQEFVTDLLNQAVDLEAERVDLMARTGANRETLRTVRKTGLLSEKQSAAIDLWYPPRTRRAAGETETAEQAAA